MIDECEVEQTLNMLGFLPGENVEITGIAPKRGTLPIKARRVPVLQGGPRFINEVKAIASGLAREGYGVYITPNPVAAGAGRPRDSEVTAVRWLLIDIDAHDNENGNLKHAEECARQIQEMLKAKIGGQAPLIFTGGGYHLWLKTTAQADQRATFLKILDACYSNPPAFNVDISTGNLSRLMRLPGTKNVARDRMCKILTSEISPCEDDGVSEFNRANRGIIAPKPKSERPIAWDKEKVYPEGASKVFARVTIENVVTLMNSLGFEWAMISDGYAKGTCPARGEKCDHPKGAYIYAQENGVGRIMCAHHKSCRKSFSVWSILVNSNDGDEKKSMKELNDLVDSNGSGAVTVAKKEGVKRPVVEVTNNIFDTIKDVEKHLHGTRLFSYKGIIGLVRERESPQGEAPFVPLGPSGLSHFLSEVVDFERVVRGGYVKTPCPDRVCKVLEEIGSDAVKEINSFSKIPFVDKKGVPFLGTGYHPGSKTFVEVSEINKRVIERIRAEIKDSGGVSRDEAMVACAALFEILEDFPYKNTGGMAGALAWILTCVGYKFLQGPTPIFLFTANTPGSGKNTLAEIGALIGTGFSCISLDWDVSKDEIKKEFLSACMSGQIVLFDEVKKAESTFLQNIVCNENYSGRWLGVNKTVTAQRPPVCIAGNNVRVDGDMHRRVVTVSLESRYESPQFRDFKVKNILNVVAEKREELLASALKIISYGIRTKNEIRDIGRLSNFEQFWTVIGGVIYDLGVGNLRDTILGGSKQKPGPKASGPVDTGNDEDLVESEAADLAAALAAIRSESPGTFTVKSLTVLGEKSNDMDDALQILCGRDWRKMSTRSLGMYLHHRVNRIAGGHVLRVVTGTEIRRPVRTYRIDIVQEPS